MPFTPIGLARELADRIRTITAGLRMEESDGDHLLRAPNVWLQHPPLKLYADVVDPADYPFILVAVGGGSGIVENKMACEIAVLVGGYDNGQPLPNDPNGIRDRQGWTIPAMLIWRIITDLTQNPVIGPFVLDLNQLTWELPWEKQPEPQWFGTISMFWSVPIPRQDFNLGNMVLRNAPPCDHALPEEIRTFMGE